MSEIFHIDRAAAKSGPEAVFALPCEIGTEIGLTRGEKLATLRRWATAVHTRLAASSEGMATNGTSATDLKLLDEITATIRALETGEPSEVEPH